MDNLRPAVDQYVVPGSFGSDDLDLGNVCGEPREICLGRVAGCDEQDRKSTLSQLGPGRRGWSVRHPVFDGGDDPSGNGRRIRLLPDRLVLLPASLEAQGRIE